MKRTPGRNEPCWCGSGRKYKKCHFDSDREAGARPELPRAREISEIWRSILPPPHVRSDEVGRDRR